MGTPLIISARVWTVLAWGCLLAGAVDAQEVRITPLKADSQFTLNDRSFTITRDQSPNARLPEAFTLTTRPCPPDCLQPMQIAEGVSTLAELEVITFLETTVSDGDGLLLDTRPPADFVTGAIPGAVNVPRAALSPDNRYREDILQALGATRRGDGRLDFSTARVLVLYAAGPWSSDASAAVTDLLDAGYPPEKILFYRGGLQAWLHAALTVHHSEPPG